MRRSGMSCRGKDASMLIFPHLRSCCLLVGQRWRGMPPRSFLGVACCKFPRILRRIFPGGGGGESFLNCRLSILGWGRELVDFWWVTPLGEGRCLYQLAPTGLLPLPLLSRWGCVGLWSGRCICSCPCRRNNLEALDEFLKLVVLKVRQGF